MKAPRINDYGAPLHLDEVPIPEQNVSSILRRNGWKMFGRSMRYSISSEAIQSCLPMHS